MSLLWMAVITFAILQASVFCDDDFICTVRLLTKVLIYIPSGF